jgi:hypothetical protein
MKKDWDEKKRKMAEEYKKKVSSLASVDVAQSH